MVYLIKEPAILTPQHSPFRSSHRTISFPFGSQWPERPQLLQLLRGVGGDKHKPSILASKPIFEEFSSRLSASHGWSLTPGGNQWLSKTTDLKSQPGN